MLDKCSLCQNKAGYFNLKDTARDACIDSYLINTQGMETKKGYLKRVFTENISWSILFIIGVIIHFAIPLFVANEKVVALSILAGFMLIAFFLIAFVLRFYLLRRRVHWLFAIFFIFFPMGFFGILSSAVQGDGRLGFLSLISILYYYRILRMQNWPNPQKAKELEDQRNNELNVNAG